MPWVRDLLDEADVLRHEAQVLLLPEAYGYASDIHISKLWQDVHDKYVFIDNCQKKIRNGQIVLDRARAALPAYLPYLETAGRVGHESLWHQTVEAAHQLDLLLEKPQASSDSEHLSRDRLELLSGSLAGATQKLDAQLTELLRPFQPEDIRSVIRQCESTRPQPGLAEEVEAILATPFPPAADRARLWAAGLVLDRRLGELPIRDPGSSSDSARSSRERREAVRDLAIRRTRRLWALWQLASPKTTGSGLDDAVDAASESKAEGRSSGVDRASDLTALARAWRGLARAARSVHGKLLDLDASAERQEGDDRPGWITPAFTLSLSSNPARQSRDRDHLAARAWLARHYLYESRDLHKLVDPEGFYETAALECSRSDRLPPETWLTMDPGEESASGVTLSQRMNRAEPSIRILVDGPGAAPRQKLTLKVLEPDDPRLVVGPASADLEIPVQTQHTETIKVEWAEDRAGEVSGPPPAGMIIQARLPNERVYHLLVPLSINAESSRPRLVLRTDPSQGNDVSFKGFRLRALPMRQSYFLLVRNPSPVARDVIVEIVAGAKVLPAGGGKAFHVNGGATVPVPSFETPAPKPDGPLQEAPSGLKVLLRDSAAGQVLDEQPLEPAIAAPLEYLKVTQARFIPTRPGNQRNRLEVSLESLPQMTGPPALVKLIVPSDKEIFPAFREPPLGTLEGPLKPAGERLDLYAEDIKLDPAADEVGKFQLTIDGLERAIWYQTRFIVQDARPQLATVVSTPRVRFQHTIEVKQGQRARLHVVFAVDNAPPGSKLVFELGRYKNGKMATEIPRWEETPRQGHIGFDPKGEAGAILFEASIQDWVRDFDIAQIRGPRRLEASLIEPRTRKVLATWGTDEVLDDLPPEGASIVLVDEVPKGTSRLAVKATVTPPAAGIKDVAFIVGSEADFAKAEADRKTVAGEPVGDDQRAWEATLPLPKDAVAKLVVTVRFTSRKGLTAYAHKDVLVREPPPSPEEAAAKPVADKPGAIQGKVTENDVAQPGQEVLLLNPDAKPNENPVKSQTKTKKDGTYSFPDLKPGKYRVYCFKDATNRRDTKDVTVSSGETVQRDLDLILP